ncbi:uncharacterized protein RSE6_13009 [Rhynchosporium secalis]|uniref:Uncharacterized protein n=1 Tax=Rhynchosporium secalis TaxID=38038 RepID=A0A1E1MRU5_RHYSE|nr:uncharacterized protein RSE6_13009 [Rhynchosporium secalis]
MREDTVDSMGRLQAADPVFNNGDWDGPEHLFTTTKPHDAYQLFAYGEINSSVTRIMASSVLGVTREFGAVKGTPYALPEDSLLAMDSATSSATMTNMRESTQKVSVPEVMTESSTCQQSEGYCRWYGRAPSCGTSHFSWGEYDGDEKLIATTEYHNRHQLLYAKDINEDCFDKYGTGCWSGYKRLWYKKTPYTLAETAESGLQTHFQDPDTSAPERISGGQNRNLVKLIDWRRRIGFSELHALFSFTHNLLVFTSLCESFLVVLGDYRSLTVIITISGFCIFTKRRECVSPYQMSLPAGKLK